MTPDPAHRALTEEQQGRLLHAAERRGARDHATNLLRGGGSPVMVARLLGHASIDAARFYTPLAHKAALAHCCWQKELSRCSSEADGK
jgi:site-specific recombinase XerD